MFCVLCMLTHLIRSQPFDRHRHFKEEAKDAHRLRNSFKVTVSKWPSQRAHLAAWPQSASSYLLGSPASSGGNIGKCLPLGSPTDSRYIRFTECSGACSSRNSLYLCEPRCHAQIRDSNYNSLGGFFPVFSCTLLTGFCHKCL